ncbi:MAG TPA: nitrogen fixation protein NifZ [Polyangiales bacterium]
MEVTNYQEGDLVFSACDLFNDDGAIPDAASGELLAPAGARGMVVRAGYVEAQPELKVYLVRFEGADKELGPPVGCLADELTQDESVAALVESESTASASP